MSSALKGKFLTPGPPRKSLVTQFYNYHFMNLSLNQIEEGNSYKQKYICIFFISTFAHVTFAGMLFAWAWVTL